MVNSHHLCLLPINCWRKMANSRSRRKLVHREIGKVKPQHLWISALWDTEKLAKSNDELSQSLHVGTPRNRQSQMANSGSPRPLGQGEISKLSYSLLIGTRWNWQSQTVNSCSLRLFPINWWSQTANSHSLCSIGFREIVLVKRWTLAVSTH